MEGQNMTQEDKDLLLKDLCARLSYGVVIEITSDGGMIEASYDMRLDAGLLADLLHSEDDFKPYLRPMSSMIEEEVEEFAALESIDILGGNTKITCVELSIDAIDWLNAHHFDYRWLIEKGLALEAPEGMYKTQ
jgi:hypothetical protein